MSPPTSWTDKIHTFCDHPIVILSQTFIWAHLLGDSKSNLLTFCQEQKLILRNRRLGRQVHGLDDRLSHQFRPCYAQLPPFSSIPRGATEAVFSSRWGDGTDDSRKGDELEVYRNFESFALVSDLHHDCLFVVVSIWTKP